MSDKLRVLVFHHLFAAVCEEMGEALLRSAFSANIKERRDFSCALFDATGQMVAQAAHLPVHLGSTPLSVRAAMELGPFERGDTVVLNDPYAGGTHLPDITLVTPVFLGDCTSPDFFVAGRAHHADVGGTHPGSMGPSVDIHGEGLRIPPVFLVKAGVLNETLLQLVRANMRVPAEREGDLLAQLSANHVGAKRMGELAARHGRGELVVQSAALLDWTDALVQDVLRELAPDSKTVRLYFEDELENQDGSSMVLGLEIRVSPRRITFDWTAIREAMAVSAGNVETSQRLVDLALGALSQAPGLGARIPAASAGTMSNLTFGAAGRDSFAHYETIAGGAGASATGPGAHAVQTHMTNTRNTPIEALEVQDPVRIVSYTVRRGSGGTGGERGGDGLVRRLRFLVPARLSWVSQRGHRGPWGLAGGRRGKPGGARYFAGGAGRGKRLGIEASIRVFAGDEVELQTPGGGGFGA